MTIIEQLEDADKALAADGYKEWCNVRLAISEAIKALQKQDELMLKIEDLEGVIYSMENGTP